MSNTIRKGLPPLPDRMKWLPVNEKGYPVPYFVAKVDGKWDFRIVDPIKQLRCIKFDLCWICGTKLGRHFYFNIGPMCLFNCISSEPPSHKACSEFAVQACPFLTLPKAQRRDANLPEEIRNPGGIHFARNPGVAVVWHCQGYRVIDDRGIIQMGRPLDISFWAEGRPATRDEIMASYNSGLELLRQTAEKYKELDEFNRKLGPANTLLHQFLPKGDDNERSEGSPEAQV